MVWEHNPEEYVLHSTKFHLLTIKQKSSGSKFGGLMDQKRNSTDATATARRESFADQAPAPGFVGAMWNK